MTLIGVFALLLFFVVPSVTLAAVQDVPEIPVAITEMPTGLGTWLASIDGAWAMVFLLGALLVLNAMQNARVIARLEEKLADYIAPDAAHNLVNLGRSAAMSFERTVHREMTELVANAPNTPGRRDDWIGAGYEAVAGARRDKVLGEGTPTVATSTVDVAQSSNPHVHSRVVVPPGGAAPESGPPDDALIDQIINEESGGL